MPSPNSKVVLACAGSRKTTSLVEQALACVGKRVLVTTYTNENLDQINAYFCKRIGAVPENVRVVSWFGFLLQECVRPYQNLFSVAPRVSTIDFQSKPPPYAKRGDCAFYFTKRSDIYSDRVSDFAYHCNETSGGRVVSRLERIYDHIFIDEVQDFSGFDLNVLEGLFSSKITVVAVGDPRQATYTTNRGAKNKKYKRAGISEWIAEKAGGGLFAIEERTDCFRSNQAICDFADALYPGLPKTKSQNAELTGHDGVFFRTRAEVAAYIETYRPIVLRWNVKSDTMGLAAFNFGAMKGRTFDRVLIFPTKPMLLYLQTKNPEDAGDLSRLYVAVTRARYSTTFVVDA